MFYEDGTPEFVAVVGSRSYPALHEVELFVRGLAAKYPLARIVSGGASGVDITAEEEARDYGLVVRSYRPKKRSTGRTTHYEVLIHETSRFVLPMREDDGSPLRFHSFTEAAFSRNSLIVGDASVVVAFWNQESSGTRDTMAKTLKTGKPLWVGIPGKKLALADPIVLGLS